MNFNSVHLSLRCSTKSYFNCFRFSDCSNCSVNTMYQAMDISYSVHVQYTLFHTFLLKIIQKKGLLMAFCNLQCQCWVISSFFFEYGMAQHPPTWWAILFEIIGFLEPCEKHIFETFSGVSGVI